MEIGDRDATGLKETLAFPVLWFSVKVWRGDWIAPAMLILFLLLLAAAIGVARQAFIRKLRSNRVSNAPSVPPTAEKIEPESYGSD